MTSKAALLIPINLPKVSGMNSRKSVAGVSVIALCAVTAASIYSPPTPRLIYNKSESAPRGWYAIDPGGVVERDRKVGAFAPVSARNLADSRGYLPHHIPLIKTVWATAGDEICELDGVVRTANRPDLLALQKDSLGRDMPSWRGCIVLKNDEIFIVSTDVQTSFDSRYFGPVSKENVLGAARFLGTTGEILKDPVAAVGRARGERK